MIRTKTLKYFSSYSIGINYSIISTIRSLIIVGISIACMIWIGPSDLGLWSTVSIYLSYTPLIFLGVQSSLNRELPILLGQKNTDKALKLVSNARSVSIFISISIILFGIFIILIAIKNNSSINNILSLVAVIIIATSESYRVHLIATYRTTNSFIKLTKIYIIEILFTLLFLFIIYKYKYIGFLVYSVFSILLNVFLLSYWSPYRNVKLSFQRVYFQFLLKTGFLLMIFAQLKQAIPTFAKWVIIIYGDNIHLGLFTPAFAIGALMLMIPDQIANFISPKIGFNYGEHRNASLFWPQIQKAIILLPLITLPISFFIWIFSPFILNSFMPKYIESLWSIRFMSIGFVFSSSFLTQTVLYTIKAHKHIFLFLSLEGLGYFLFPILLIKFTDYNLIESVAIGITTTSVILYVVNFFMLKSLLFSRKYNIIA
jgi:O-antigen/teichoic acid export membrane protein